MKLMKTVLTDLVPASLLQRLASQSVSKNCSWR